MNSNILQAVVYIQNWGESSDVVDILKFNSNVISVFHIMGGYSYLIDANFDSKAELEKWIEHMKSIKLSSGVPAVTAIKTQKIIEINKNKSDFSLSDYMKMDNAYHFFILVDVPHRDEQLIEMAQNSQRVSSLVHIQGDHSYVAEVICDDYDEYRKFLRNIKQLESINRVETQEVISVIKYRNQILDESGKLSTPREDNREMYTL